MTLTYSDLIHSQKGTNDNLSPRQIKRQTKLQPLNIEQLDSISAAGWSERWERAGGDDNRLMDASSSLN